jgi:hypothetical protein
MKCTGQSHITGKSHGDFSFPFLFLSILPENHNTDGIAGAASKCIYDIHLIRLKIKVDKYKAEDNSKVMAGTLWYDPGI